MEMFPTAFHLTIIRPRSQFSGALKRTTHTNSNFWRWANSSGKNYGDLFPQKIGFSFLFQNFAHVREPKISAGCANEQIFGGTILDLTFHKI